MVVYLYYDGLHTVAIMLVPTVKPMGSPGRGCLPLVFSSVTLEPTKQRANVRRTSTSRPLVTPRPSAGLKALKSRVSGGVRLKPKAAFNSCFPYYYVVYYSSIVS